MKKTLIITLGICAMTMISCSKEYECECIESYEGTGASWETATSYTLEKMPKKDAQATCDTGDDSQTLFDTEIYTQECELK